ncbi:MAG: glycoside hydrolase family 9 protein [Fibrobacter sp.]|jgi:hypothetical protein|nr:glycoside hydrolase family 9 protein [Fibrobacter sp.]
MSLFKISFRNAVFFSIFALSFAFAQLQIQVNQVGYEQTAPKRAVVQSSNAITDTRAYLVNTQGTELLEIELGEQMTVDSWTGRYFKVADFSAFTEAGEGYQIKVGGTLSREFAIGEKLLQTKTGSAQVQFFNGMRYFPGMTFSQTANYGYSLEDDSHVRINGSSDYHDIRGGWWDANGDPGKHLSHLSYANYFSPQQIPLVVWSLLHAAETQPDVFNSAATRDEAAWGADYLLRSLASEGYFYMSVFDNWGGWGIGGGQSQREICEWSGENGIRSANYQSAMREGGGVSIAALARASKAGISGDSSAARYLAGAERAYAHLKANPTLYQNDNTENIIDYYTGLLATSELYNATQKAQYCTDAAERAGALLALQTNEGWFYTVNKNGQNTRSFYHAADEGMPVVALVRYIEVCNPGNKSDISQAIKKNLEWYVSITGQGANPFNYVKMYAGATNQPASVRFFMPQTNETGYWWQGENARLASLASAFIMGAPYADPTGDYWETTLFSFATSQLDWILGKNPYNASMMAGFGRPDSYGSFQGAFAKGKVHGGIVNGITGSFNSDALQWGTDWRWMEQWLPHNAWYLTAVTSLSYRIDHPIDEPQGFVKPVPAASARLKIAVVNGRTLMVDLPATATQINLYNMQGQKLFSHFVSGGSSEMIQIPSNVKQGAYLVSVQDKTGKNRLTGKVHLW